MKCNKCCSKIPENEEIRSDKQFYCEICWKSDNWKRTGAKVTLNILFVITALVGLAVAYYVWREAKNIKPKKCDRKHYKDEEEEDE